MQVKIIANYRNEEVSSKDLFLDGITAEYIAEIDAESYEEAREIASENLEFFDIPDINGFVLDNAEVE